MKFKWIGDSRVKDLDLVLHGIMAPDEELMKNKIIEVPDSEKVLINRLKINGNYEVQKNIIKPKKSKKEKKEEKE